MGLGFFSALPTFAQDVPVYTPIVQIPNIDPNVQDTQQYIRALYMLSISAAALLAVIKIIFGGVKWMLSDVVTDKSAAVKDIRGALFGLLIVIGAVLILGTINPALLNLNIFNNAPALENQNPSHDNIRDSIREEYSVVDSTFNGDFGSPEHKEFLDQCRAEGGKLVLSETSNTVVECRVQ